MVALLQSPRILSEPPLQPLVAGRGSVAGQGLDVRARQDRDYDIFLFRLAV
jgi:hypothetical protein